MDEGRRFVLRSAGATGALAAALAAGLLKPERVLAATWNKAAFAAKSPVDALRSIGAANTIESKDVVIELPQIAENGAVVPIDITSNIPGTSSISVFIEKNPFPYTGTFDFAAGTVPYVHLRAKLGKSTPVRIVVAANGKYYTAAKEVKVTIGGCGG